MTKRLDPPNFTNPKLALVWAALGACEPDEALQFTLELNTMLGRGSFPITRSKDRQADAIACLREAAQELGGSPTLRAYEELRKEKKELDLVPAGSIRTRLGSGWNDCLRRAELDQVDPSDLPGAQQFVFSEEDTLQALHDCKRDLGFVPTAFSYRYWARRPDVRVRPGKRPLTDGPFNRLFGNFSAALRAAGIVGESVRRQGGRVERTEWSYPEEEILSTLRFAHKTLGFSPSVQEYDTLRREIKRRIQEGEDLASLPAPSTIMIRFRTWANALESAGLPERRIRKYGRHTSKPGPKEPTYSDEQVIEWVRRAYREIGEPFTEEAYQTWRTETILRERPSKTSIPSSWTVGRRFRGWHSACDRALRDMDTGSDDDCATSEPVKP